MTESADPEQIPPQRPAHLWKPGQSGNPAGKPKGQSIHKAMQAAVSREDLEDIIRTVVDRAKEGDLTAAGIVMSRLVPAMKPISAPVEIPVAPGADIAQKAGAVADAVLTGDVSPSDGKEVLMVLSGAAQIDALRRIEERLADVELKLGGRR